MEKRGQAFVILFSTSFSNIAVVPVTTTTANIAAGLDRGKKKSRSRGWWRRRRRRCAGAGAVPGEEPHGDDEPDRRHRRVESHEENERGVLKARPTVVVGTGRASRPGIEATRGSREDVNNQPAEVR